MRFWLFTIWPSRATLLCSLEAWTAWNANRQGWLWLHSPLKLFWRLLSGDPLLQVWLLLVQVLICSSVPFRSTSGNSFLLLLTILVIFPFWFPLMCLHFANNPIIEFFSITLVSVLFPARTLTDTSCYWCFQYSNYILSSGPWRKHIMGKEPWSPAFTFLTQTNKIPKNRK